MNKKAFVKIILIIILIIVALMIIGVVKKVKDKKDKLNEGIENGDSCKQVRSCINGDGCCPSVCNSNNDNDCKSSSNGNKFSLDSGYHDFSLNHDGLKRTYHVYVPSSYNKETKIPVVFLIHGGGGNGNQVRGTQNMDEIADREGFIVVYPDGTGKEILGKKLFTWNSGNCCGQSVEKDIDDVGFFEKMINELPNNFNVDKQRIYVTGISNGGQMSHRLACELSDKIAAVAPIAGPVGVDNEMPPCNPLNPISVLIYHGKQDPCALYDGGCLPSGGCFFREAAGIEVGELTCMLSTEEVKNKWITRNNCLGQSSVTYEKGDVKCLTYSDCNEESEVVLCTSETAGHTWPSGTTKIDNVVGEVTYDFSNEQIWEFFKDKRL